MPCSQARVPLPALHLSPPLGRVWHLLANEKKSKATKEGSRFGPLRREPKFAPKGPLALQTGSTTGQRTLMGNPVWTGLEAGIRCSAHQCSKVWLFLRDHLRSRTFAFHLPRPDPVHKVAHRFLHLSRVMRDFDFSHGCTWMQGLYFVPPFPPPPRFSPPPWEVHVTDKLHLHLHHLSHPAPFRRAHAGHTKVRDPAGGWAGWGEVETLPMRLNPSNLPLASGSISQALQSPVLSPICFSFFLSF